jgi:hypothetical protein
MYGDHIVAVNNDKCWQMMAARLGFKGWYESPLSQSRNKLKRA